MAYTYEDVIPSIITNTIMRKRLRDGVHTTYTIEPADGYVLHDNLLDIIHPEDTGLGTQLGYTTGTCTCVASYDFTVNDREFYAVPRDTVPKNQIFGGGDNDHEIA